MHGMSLLCNQLTSQPFSTKYRINNLQAIRMAKNEEEMSRVELSSVEHQRKENIERRFSLYSLLRGIMIPGIIITGMCCSLPSLLRGFCVCEEGQNNNSGRAELDS